MSDLYLSRIRNWFLGSPPAEWALHRLRETLIGALSQGPIPRHVAFEMDGNRRYARSHKIETVEGHHLGFEALARVLEICYKCGVKVVTVYAFSLENFNRPRYEVDGLMELAKVKLEQLIQHGELLDRYGASVRVLGRTDLLPPDTLEVVERAVAATSHNTTCILNICFPYTSREEMTTAIKTTVEEYSTTPQPHSTTFSQSRITQKILSKQDKTAGALASIEESPSPPIGGSSLDDHDDAVSTSTTLHSESSTTQRPGDSEKVAIYPNAETITPETIDKHMYTAGCPPVDIFVRTSGVERLSDFLLWQSHQDTQIFFLKCFWPEFDLWHFLPLLEATRRASRFPVAFSYPASPVPRRPSTSSSSSSSSTTDEPPALPAESGHNRVRRRDPPRPLPTEQMRTAKPPAPESGGSSSRRAQPVRQTRINPPRNSSLNRGNSFPSVPAPEQPIDVFPGVTHFADAITALPKEIVRHFTLLKEVDAKIFQHEGKLFEKLRSALDTPPSSTEPPASSLNDASSSAARGSTPISVQNSSVGAPPNVAPIVAAPADGPANLARRHLFRDTAWKLQEMMVALEEKNHVLLTANDALEKQMRRVDEIWPRLESEFSEEAKWGSSTHWAYVENRQAQQQAKTNEKAERSRREAVGALTAAAQHLAEEAAARSNDRKQAMAAKKNSKAQAAEADADKGNEAGKKTQGGGKSRKAAAEPVAPVGLGITTGAPAAPAPAKRRKAEAAKASNGGTPGERAMSTVFGSGAAKPKPTSPSETPVPESGPKKRKALPTSSGQAKKSRTNAAMSPSMASSPVIGTFSEPTKGSNDSLTPAAAVSAAAPPRPQSSRARQNSTQSNVENTRQRLPSEALTKPNGNSQETLEQSQQSNGAKAASGPKAQKETPTPATSKLEGPKQEIEIPPPVLEPPLNGNKKESTTKAAAAAATPHATPIIEEQKKESAALVIQPAPAVRGIVPPASIKESGVNASSSASTPMTASKSSAHHHLHKETPDKGLTNQNQQALLSSSQQDGSVNPDDEEEPDGDEPRYCKCNGVSYGEMVACDGEGCAREWFHLECVGLKVAPKGNAKWYCDECKERVGSRGGRR
ncbi:putative undecaprenyl diphosphate synthase-domain-containing protein [Cladorrhinum samala]|uniref:Chromatin modification-related protein n=1 Tax=Cladorrhinum samala TaxID=585594 RepID=A0AAV9HBF7_9PEZI|nr:putative undecaprenyl diphosphate synthase-domain-containing protein [Cladorrhinum samala]